MATIASLVAENPTDAITAATAVFALADNICFIFTDRSVLILEKDGIKIAEVPADRYEEFLTMCLRSVGKHSLNGAVERVLGGSDA